MQTCDGAALFEYEEHRPANAAASEASAGARRAEEATRGTSHSVVEGRGKSRGTSVIGRKSGDDTEYGVVRLRDFHLPRGSCRSGLLALMTLWARTGWSRLRKPGSRMAHQVMARRRMTIHRVTTMPGQIIATGCPSSTGIQRNEREQTQRQTTASEQAPRQRLETLPLHLGATRNQTIDDQTATITRLVRTTLVSHEPLEFSSAISPRILRVDDREG